MKTHQLRALVAVATAGSIKGAAAALHVTQPAVSKAIQEMENEFGVPLLERMPWGVVPTPEGDALLGRAQAVVRELERAREDMAHMKGLRDGRLVIGFTPIVAVTGFADAYATFRRHWPHVECELRELTFTQLAEQLRNRTLDLAFAAVTGPLAESADVKAIRAFDTVFVTRENGRFAGATSLDALREAEWIHADASESFPAYIRDLHERAGLPPPHCVTRCTSYALFYSLLLTTDAVFSWTRHSLAETVFGQKLTPLPLPMSPPPLQLYRLTPPGLQLTRPASDFLAYVETAFASQPVVGKVPSR
ncbi:MULTISPECIES: LysR family transcriptional regulator [Burkholderia]|uniref:LysR family transcriptional regulator n=1 Tax=Burkholderia cenocepacia TaxID=95486 RepID=A0A071MLD6_9BURK|nr:MULTISPECIES: LysR family transcriptional regulator [Burkholderia]MBJ9590987.1 LysR family transcriptional regulator [Burkholderia seminalis]MBN3737029.1 LysR family transcriptional regulator [Burkholderia sp. Tr-20355]MCA8424491.1 LysR family transcriptional regulator [Burkholderia seminalis]MCA8429285.1 LysR family transcriptional regulator [Burkholderia seminalis]MDN7849459.1 LysR family transcriptional regulator [Burkholderia seminalis]